MKTLDIFSYFHTHVIVTKTMMIFLNMFNFPPLYPILLIVIRWSNLKEFHTNLKWHKVSKFSYLWMHDVLLY